MRARLPALALAAALAACLAPGAAASAPPRARAAFRLEGKRWPGIPRIAILNRTAYRREVGEAIATWNATGARLRLALTRSPAAADVVIGYLPGRANDAGGVWGQARTGYVPPGALLRDPSGAVRRAGPGLVLLKRLLHPGLLHVEMTATAVHELGHMLGLGHEERRCATMNSVRGGHCPRPRSITDLVSGVARCSYLEPDDVRGIVRLYGGRPRRPRSLCPHAPGRLRAGYVPSSLALRVSWRRGGGPAPSTIAEQVTVGGCGVGVGSRLAPLLAPRRVGVRTQVELRFAGDLGLPLPYVPTRICVTLQAVRRVGASLLLSGLRRVELTYDPPLLPGPDAVDAAVRTDAGDVLLDVSWSGGRLVDTASWLVAAAPGACPADPVPGAFTASREVDASEQTATLSALADDFYRGPGPYCVAVWSSDRLGRASARAALASVVLP